MNVIIKIEGREAIPVRAIPLLADWQTMTPDALGQALAGDEHFFHFENMQAFRFVDGKVIRPGWWQSNAVRPLMALSDNIRATEITHETGLQEFRTESLKELPAGVYVWRDEFEPAYKRHYGKPALPQDFEGKDVQLTDGESAKLTAEHQERIALDYAPFVTQVIHALVMEGFSSGAEPDTAPAQNTATPAPVVTVGASDDVESANAGPMDKAPAHEPQAARAGPRFSMTKAALIASHEHEWPSIRVDISGAADNELKAAKAGPRGWHEDIAMEWARAKGKLNTPVKPADELAAAVHSMANVPSRQHLMKG